MAPPPDSPPPSTWLDESEYQDQTRTINEQLDVENICLLSLEGTAEDTPQRRAEIQVTIRSLKKQLKQLRLARQKQESAQQQAPPPANTNKKLDMFGYRFGSDGIDPSKLIAHNANNLGRPPRGEKRSYSDHRGDSLSGFPKQSDWKSRKTTPDTRPGNRAGWHDGGADDGDSSSVIDLTREDDDGDVSDWKEQQREAAETYRRNKEQEEEDARYARLLQDSAYEGLDFSAATTSLPPPAQSGSSSFGQIPSQNYSKTPMPYGSNHNLPLRSPQSAYVPGPSHTVLHDSASASKPSRMPGAWDSGDDDDDIIGPLSSPGQMSNAFGPGFGAASSSGYGAGDFARQAAARRQRQLQYANNGGRISSAPSLVPGASSSSAANGQLGSRPGSLFNGSANPWANRAGMYRPNGMSLPGRDSLSQIINRTNNYNWDEGLDEFGLPLPDHVVSYIDDYVSDPRKTDQQIKELLANISPDMDVTEEDREGTPEGLKYPLYKHQQIALKWMRAREDDEKTKGGLLADDMGLGKTISMLALLLSRPAHKNSDSKKSKADVVKTNVIVGPVALIRQWEREIEKKIKSGHRLSVHNYHRKKATYRDLRKFDVVLNSYGKLGAELKELEKYTQDCGNNGTVPSQEHLMKICPFVGPKSMFYRVVLDEAQCIKNKNTQMAKACYRIQAQHRWCLSGTPMMNSVDELASLVHFLRIKPFDDFKEFAKTFNILSGKRSSFGNVRGRAMERLQILLKSFMLRRTKSSKIDGKPIIELKPKVEMTDHVVFNEDEAQYYQDLEKTSQVTFSKFLQAGTVGKKYNQVLVLLLRLRQACCHPYLHITDLDYGSHEISEDDMVDLAKQLDAAVVKRIKEQEPPFECPICYDTTINPSIMLPCGHYTCGECLVRLSGQSAQQNLQAGQEGTGTQCPECRTLVNLKKVVVYDVFQQVHMPEAVEPAAGASTAGGADADETDSDETDSETDSDDSATASEGEEDDDVDEYGDLQDFIVHDDDDGVSSSGTKDEEDDGSDFTPSDSTKEAGGIKSSKRKSRSAKAKSKLKSKGKGKQPRKQADHKGKKKASAVTPETLGKLRKEASNNAQAHREYMKYLRKIWLSSAKVAKCKELIENIQKTGEKTIVFSQWTLLLDLLEIPVKHELKLSFRRYDGGMSASNRDAAVRDFMENENVKVILVSLKAGNSGLNLTAASQVIIMDPFWNPYTEMQAVDRAHRIGQQNPVQVHRVLVKGTVEDRIMELQDKKRELVDTALDEGVAKQLGRLNSNDLAYLFGIGSH